MNLKNKENAKTLIMKTHSILNIGIRFLFILALVFMIQYASASLGTTSQSSCMNIKVLSNCSSVTLVEASSNKQTFVINNSMSKIVGQTFGYSFCNTSDMSSYSYSWYDPCLDCSDGNCGNTFEVTADGHPYTDFPIVYFIIILGLMFLILNRYLNRIFEIKNLLNIFAGMFFLVAGILTLYPGFNYINYTNLPGLALGIVLIGVGGILVTKQLEDAQIF